MVKRAKARVFGNNRPLELILTPIAAAMLTATPVAAQQLEETIVTATRRAQSTQDVPDNISAIGANDLKNSALVNSGDLLQQIPGIFVSRV